MQIHLLVVLFLSEETLVVSVLLPECLLKGKEEGRKGQDVEI